MKKQVLRNFRMNCLNCWNNKEVPKPNIHITKGGIAFIECLTCGIKEEMGIVTGSNKTTIKDYEESLGRKLIKN